MAEFDSRQIHRKENRKEHMQKRRGRVEKAGQEGGTILFNWLQNIGSASDAVSR